MSAIFVGWPRTSAGTGLKAQELAERGTASAYDNACGLLVDLSEAYGLKQRRMEFSKEIARFRSTCARRGALIRRLDSAGLK